MARTYFIGLGGCGLETVAELHKRYKDSKDAAEYLYTYIDTDAKTRNRINDAEYLIPSEDFINLGDTNTYQLYEEARKGKGRDQRRVCEWAISQEPGHLTFPNQALFDGAKAERNIGRFGFYKHYGRIESHIENRIRKFGDLKEGNKDQVSKDVDIWVFASSCGGTGSSMILDTLYMINRIGIPIAGGEPNVKLMLYMPKGFMDVNKGNDSHHPLNGYACLWELNQFRLAYENGNGKVFENFSVKPAANITDVQSFPLCKYIIPVDAETNFNTHIPLTKMYSTMAEMVYYINCGTGSDSIKSKLSNDTEEIVNNRKNYREDYTTSLIAYGFRALKKPNEELKSYLISRGLYEVLQYGLLDNGNMALVPEKKKDFAEKYILPKLVSFNAKVGGESCSVEAGEYSIQSQVEELYSSINFRASDHDARILQSAISKLDGVERDELMDIKEKICETLQSDIDRGVNQMIVEHGLNFTYRLLDTLDDYYLQLLLTPMQSQLNETLANAEDDARSRCNTIIKNGINRRNESAAEKAFKDLREAIVARKSMQLAIEVIEQLTTIDGGYLEVLRRGDNQYTGIKRVIDEMSILCNEKRTDYMDLAKKFRATANDAMTVYMPSLMEMTTEQDVWAEGHKFDRLYRKSILEQEEIQRGLSKVTEPKRESTSGLCLSEYLKNIDKEKRLYISIIKSDPEEFSRKHEEMIAEPIISEMMTAAAKPASEASKWLNKPLSDILNDKESLPSAYKKKEDLCDSFSNLQQVPFFYPVRQGATSPKMTRTLYVGADVDLASQLGFKKGPNTEFIPDTNMTDRFLILNMPGGYDFYSYKYFLEIEALYMQQQDRIRRLEFGCHIHQAFNQSSDLAGALQRVKMPALTQIIGKVLKMNYLQNAVKLLAQHRPIAHNQLFAKYDLNIGLEDFGDTDSLLLGGDDTLSLDSSASASLNTDLSTPDQFFDVSIQEKPLRVTLTLHKVTYDKETNSIAISQQKDDIKQVVIEQSQLMKPSSFAEELEKIKDEFFSALEAIDQAKSNNTELRDSLNYVSPVAIKELKALKSNGKFNLAAIINLWIRNKNPEESILISQVLDFINNINK